MSFIASETFNYVALEPLLSVSVPETYANISGITMYCDLASRAWINEAKNISRRTVYGGT